MTKELYVVSSLILWESLLVEYPIPRRLAPRLGGLGIGFLPVYESRERAEAEYPGKEIKVIRIEVLDCDGDVIL